jgi:hypothetical protein
MQPGTPTDAAAVVLWARIFDAVAFLVGLGMTVLYAMAFVFPFFTGVSGRPSSNAVSQPAFQITLTAAAVSILASALLYLPPAIGLGPGRGWLWTWQLVALVLSVISGCILGNIGLVLLAPAIILWTFWVKPEVRRYCEEG